MDLNCVQVRRTRISERMRKLQDLVPNMDKVEFFPFSISASFVLALDDAFFPHLQQTNTSDMLDLAVDYIKDLQRQVQVCYTNEFEPKPTRKNPTKKFLPMYKHSCFMFFFPDTFRDSCKVCMHKQAEVAAAAAAVVEKVEV